MAERATTSCTSPASSSTPPSRKQSNAPSICPPSGCLSSQRHGTRSRPHRLRYKFQRRCRRTRRDHYLGLVHAVGNSQPHKERDSQPNAVAHPQPDAYPDANA